MQQALLIGNGEISSAVFIKEIAKKVNFILAADGGANNALKTGITPDLVIGDLDSISSELKNKLPTEKLLYIDNQNNTDLEKSLIYLIEKGFTDCILVGFLGARWDFSIGNLLTVARFLDRLNIQLEDAYWKIFPLTKGQIISCSAKKRVSIIPLTNCKSVSLLGLKYTLNDTDLSVGTTRTLSNETLGNSFEIKMKQGCLIAYLEK